MSITNGRRVSRSLHRSALGLLACTALTAPAYAQDAAPQSGATQLDEIVVTARRTEENL